MIFRDGTLMAGRIHSRRRWDSDALAPAAVAVCHALLIRLQAGEARVEHGQAGLPPFWVMRGLPDYFPPAPGHALFFCVGAPGEEPFQYNLLLHLRTSREAALWGLTTALALSRASDPTAPVTVAALEEMLIPLYDERPLLATALLPVAGADPETIRVAADFSTCFAAAWLLAP